MNCKSYLLTIALVLSTAVFGQRYGVVDTDYILKSLPEYAQAKSQIDKLSEQWVNETDISSFMFTNNPTIKTQIEVKFEDELQGVRLSHQLFYTSAADQDAYSEW